METNKLLSPDDMLKLSEKGEEIYKRKVLQGSTLKSIITSIEDAALEGYKGWQKTLHSSDDMRELKVIRDYLKENGYYCEFETESNLFTTKKFVVHWRV